MDEADGALKPLLALGTPLQGCQPSAWPILSQCVLGKAPPFTTVGRAAGSLGRVEGVTLGFSLQEPGLHCGGDADRETTLGRV